MKQKLRGPYLLALLVGQLSPLRAVTLVSGGGRAFIQADAFVGTVTQEYISTSQGEIWSSALTPPTRGIEAFPGLLGLRGEVAQFEWVNRSVLAGEAIGSSSVFDDMLVLSTVTGLPIAGVPNADYEGTLLLGFRSANGIGYDYGWLEVGVGSIGEEGYEAVIMGGAIGAEGIRAGAIPEPSATLLFLIAATGCFRRARV